MALRASFGLTLQGPGRAFEVDPRGIGRGLEKLFSRPYRDPTCMSLWYGRGFEKLFCRSYRDPMHKSLVVSMGLKNYFCNLFPPLMVWPHSTGP